MAIFTGAGVAIVTPMQEGSKEVNFEMLGDIIEEQIKGGTDSIIICGTTGESSTLSHEEHIATIKSCVDKVAGRVPVIAGTGSNSTDEAIYLSMEAEKVGADGLLIVTPYYNKATQQGLYEHFKTIADMVKIPIILYNVPGRTGMNLIAATAARLFHDVENIVGMKEASGNVGQAGELMHLTNGEMDLYSGNDDIVVPLLSIGGKGVISVVSNVAPKYMHDMVMSFMDGDTKTAAKMQTDLIPLCKAIFSEVNPIPVKAAMIMQGFEVGPPRLPLTVMEAANQEKLFDEMKKMNFV